MKKEHQIPLIDRFSHIQFPDNLNKQDKELVLQQCDIQGDLYNEAIIGFANAYSDAKQLAEDKDRLASLSEEQFADLILKWATMIDNRNKNGVRTTEVTFQNGNKALEARKVPRAMEMYCWLFTDFDSKDDNRMTPVQYYKEFENIHPLEDGNGRLGDLLWKVAMTRETGTWPETLPPDLFGEDRTMLDESA